MAQGLVPFLGTFLNYLLLLDTNMEDYLEVSEPGGGAGDQDSEIWEERLALRPELATLGKVLS